MGIFSVRANLFFLAFFLIVNYFMWLSDAIILYKINFAIGLIIYLLCKTVYSNKLVMPFDYIKGSNEYLVEFGFIFEFLFITNGWHIFFILYFILNNRIAIETKKQDKINSLKKHRPR